MFGNNRFAVVDATVSQENAYQLFPGYEMYSFAIFDNNLTKDKFLITLATPLYVVTFGANGMTEGVYDGKISDLLLQAGYEDPNILIKCKRTVRQKRNEPETMCETRFATIATPSDLVEYKQTRLGLLQSFAITEYVDSWPSMFMRLVTESVFACVLFSSTDGKRITWDKATSSLMIRTKDEQLAFDNFSSFCDYINTVQGTIDKVSIETSSYQILIHQVPSTILDIDGIKNSPGIRAYYNFDRHTPLWNQVIKTFFVPQPEDKLLGIAKYRGMHMPLYAIASKNSIIVPKAWCASESTYECLKVSYKEYESDKVIKLDRLSGDGGCAAYKNDSIGAGTLLLDMAKDLAKYVLQATTLELDDLSTVRCKDDKYSTVRLSLVSYLKKQKTWYETKDIKPFDEHKYERAKKVLETDMGSLALVTQLLQLDMVEDVDRSLPDMEFIIASLGCTQSSPPEDLKAKLTKFVFNMIFFLEIYASDSFMQVLAPQWAKDTNNQDANEFWYDNEEEDEPTPGTVRSDALSVTRYLLEPVNLCKVLGAILIPNGNNISTVDNLISGLQSIGFYNLSDLDSLINKYGPIPALVVLLVHTLMTEVQYAYDQRDEYYHFKNMVGRVGRMASAFRQDHRDLLMRIAQYPNAKDSLRQFLSSLYDEGCNSVFIPMKNFLINDLGYAHILFFERSILSVWNIPRDEKQNDLKRKSSDESDDEQPTKYGKFDLTPFMMDYEQPAKHGKFDLTPFMMDDE